MPLVKDEITLAAGATSQQVLAGTTYEYVGPGTQIVVAAGAGDGSGGIAADDPTGVVMETCSFKVFFVPSLVFSAFA